MRVPIAPVLMLAASFILLIGTPARADRSLGKMVEACVWAWDHVQDGYHHLRGRTPEEIAELQRERAEEREARKKAVADWWAEVKRTRGARLLIKDIKEPEPSRLLSGLFHEHRPPEEKRWYHHFKYVNPMFYFQLLFRAATKWLTGKPHDLNVFSFAYHTFLRRPTAALTNRVVGRRQEPTLLVKLPLAFTTGWLVLKGIDKWWEKELEEKLEESIDEHGPEYDDMIENDFRFASLREMKNIPNENGQLPTQKEMRVAAFKLLQAHLAYARYMSDEAEKDDPKTRREKRLAAMTLLAPHIPELAKEGVQDRPGFLVPEDKLGKLTNRQIDDLLDIQDELFTRYHVIWTHLRGKPEEKDKMMKSPHLARRLKAMLDDPYVKALFDLKARGELTDNELLVELQLDSEWKGRFASCEVMGIVPLKKGPDGFLAEPLTLMSVRLEALEALAEQARNRGDKK